MKVTKKIVVLILILLMSSLITICNPIKAAYIDNFDKTSSDKVMQGATEIDLKEETGYIISSAISNSSTTSSQVNLREAASTGSNAIRLLSQGTPITVLQRDVAYSNGYWWSKIAVPKIVYPYYYEFGKNDPAAGNTDEDTGIYYHNFMFLPNVYCAQKGVMLGWNSHLKWNNNSYIVGEEKTVSDPMLAYILAHGSTTKRNYLTDKTQNALWRYLNNSQITSEDKTSILGTLTSGDGSDTELYNEADKYKTSYTNNGDNITLTVDRTNLSGNKLGIKVNGAFKAFELYMNGVKVGDYTKSYDAEYNGEIDISNYVSVGQVKVEVKAKITKYTVKYRVLYSDGNQRLMVVTSVKDTGEIKADDEIVLLNTNVSLQKYITHVNGNAVTSRLNKKATDNTKDPIYWNNSSGSNIYSSSGANTYKRNNIIKIDVGDTVTYKIDVYNNSSVTAKDIEITDILPLGADKYSIGDRVQNTASTSIPGDRKITYNIDSLSGYSSTSIYVAVHFNQYRSDILENNAKITDTTPDNNTNYRTEDSDYVQMKEYAVSLEKYISKVNGVAINRNRAGKAEYLTKNGNQYVDNTNSDKQWTRHNSDKYNSVVEVSNGDYVTYTITVNNDSETGAVYIRTIIDTLPEGISHYKVGEYSGKLSDYTEVPSDRVITINRDGGTLLGAGKSRSIHLTVKVSEPNSLRVLTNNAKIGTIQNSGGNNINDTTPYNNEDNDYIRTKECAVSLEKYISKVNGVAINTNRAGKAEYLTKNGNQYIDNTKSDKQWTRHNSDKYNSVVEVSNGDYVTYTITVNNDSKTEAVYIRTIIDKLPEGISHYKVGDYSGNLSDYTAVPSNRVITIDRDGGTLLGTGKTDKSRSILLTVKVSEPNISIRVLANNAKIGTIQNSGGNNINDTTPYNNEDNDYIQMKDIIISGTVWNDIPSNKLQDNYNGLFDNGEEVIPNIKVSLYRVGTAGAIATKYTDENGKYTFSAADIDNSTNGIKASKVSSRWNTYHSYYVVFEYDGVTYTSTPDGKTCKNVSDTGYKTDSNAREDNNLDRNLGVKSRTQFNSNFNPINNNSGINYDTKNENGYIPQSLHNSYDANGKLLEKYKMQSSTNLINISQVTEDQLQYVNLGLRGRDIFDLELTSDVDNIKVTVNGQQGVYKYANKVNLRKSDLTSKSTTDEDMANIQNESSNVYVDRQDQNIRRSDFNVDTNRYNANQGVSNIEVTYKITVHNTSRTPGTATKITNYYDNKYNFVRAYHGDNNLSTSSEVSGTNYSSIVITTPETMLNQAEKMEIYVVYSLKEPITSTLAGLTKENPIPTYNMAEITEYKTGTASNQTIYTKGLIDKDSAPGSVNSEKVRLTEGANNGTTLSYYFGGNDLIKLKYEDDTYATPTLYFVIPHDDNGTSDNSDDDNYYNRTITGIVFEDKTTTNSETRVKTGNGKLEDGEAPVYGATIELIEQVEGGKVRYTTTTNTDGSFIFSGFLPGNYIIRYHYGDTTNTVLLHQAGENVNKQSYNGEDYQSTNNIGTYGAYTLSNRVNFWYLENENEGISTATDDPTRRADVSNYVIGFTDEEMTVLNNMRDMVGTYNNNTLTATKKYNDNKTELIDISETKVTNIEDIIEETQMHAATDNMLFTLEKSEIVDNEPKQIEGFDNYIVSNMNFGIAEVPVTTVNLEKTVKSFTLTDSTGRNVIAGATKNNNGEWETEGNVVTMPGVIDLSIEDDKLQGARLQVVYAITSKINVEKNFDGRDGVAATITGVVDYIDNNLSYNAALGDNSRYWEITTFNAVKQEYEKMKYRDGTIPQGTVDPEGTKHTTIVKATENNPILTNKDGTETATIILEKVLSSTDATLEEIITSTVDTYLYNNTIEITGLSYENVTSEDSESEEDVQRDRIRTEDRYIILPGVHHDSESAEIITIHPPTGDSSVNIMYYITAIISLVILAAGVFGIRKFVLKK